MANNTSAFVEELKAIGLSQRAFIRLVDRLGHGAPPPTVSTVNRWCNGHLDVPGYAFAILALYRALPGAQRLAIGATRE